MTTENMVRFTDNELKSLAINGIGRAKSGEYGSKSAVKNKSFGLVPIKDCCITGVRIIPFSLKKSSRRF